MKSVTYIEVDVPEFASPEQIAATLTYDFTNNSVLGWAASESTVTANFDGLIYTVTSDDPQLVSPAALTIDGATNHIIRLDLERTALRTAGSWDGKIFYNTAGHGFSGSFFKSIPDLPNVIGARAIYFLDMSQLTAGGLDWTTSIISQFRIDLDDNQPTGVSAGSAFRVRSISVGSIAQGRVARFDGATYLTRGAPLTGAADSKQFTFSCWVNRDAGNLGGRLLSAETALGGSNPGTRAVYNGGATTLGFAGHNAAGTQIMGVNSSATPDSQWVHFLASFDMSDPAKRWLYINDVSDLAVVGAYVDDVLDFTYPEWSIGAYADGSNAFKGAMADVWLMPGVYMDLSVEANRRKFISEEGSPVNLGLNGEVPTGAKPLVFMSGPRVSWALNKASGGGFVTHGALADQDFAAETFRFAIATDYLPPEIDAIASLTSVSFTPAIISLGKDLGQRATLTASFKDHKHIFGSDSFDSGSFWGKWRAKYGTRLRGIPIRWINGLLGQALSAMETRHFIIESTDGPNMQGVYTITAKDALKFADGDRAQAPVLSNGSLVADITNVATSLTLTPVGIGDVEYPHTGYIAIGGEEIVSFTRIGGNDANTLLLCHYDGVDESTTAADFNDVSSFARAATRAGNVKIDSAQFVFGGTSAFFDGTGDAVTYPDSNDWAFSGDFTLEARIRPTTSLAAVRTIMNQGTGSNRWQFRLETTGAMTYFEIVGGVTTVNFASAGGLFTIDTWYHVAVTRQGNVFRMYRNGVQIATATVTVALTNFASVLAIGCQSDVTSEPFLGWIDEARISKIARYTAAFTPDVQAFQSGDILNITRAQMNTDATAHQAGDRAQLCLYYQGQDPANIIYDLMFTYAGMPAVWLPLTAWLAETAAYLQRVYTAFIAEPTAVRDLVDELIEQAALAMWWDPIGEQVRLQVLRSILTNAATFNADNMMENTLQITEQPTARVSQCYTYFGQRNPLEGIDEEKNFRSTLLTLDPETELGYGSPAIKKIFSRWIPFGGRTIATRLNNIVIGRFKNPPRRFVFDTFKPGQQDVILGQGYQLEAWPIQNLDGTLAQVPIQVTRLAPFADRFTVEAEEMLFEDIAPVDLVNRVIIVDANSYNLNMRTMHDSLYPVPTGTEIPAININCIVESGVIVGSKSTSLRSFEVGDWPAGFNASNLKVTVRGRIEGKGGIGGEGNGNWFSFPGLPGGPAFYTRELITVDVSLVGQIWGGGGGGGGGTHGSKATGGGGGAGADPGNGGAGSGGNTDRDGFPGTTEVGGAGGNASGGGHGGPGGGPGLAGSSSLDYVINPGGAAGTAVDGVSFVTYVGVGDRRGPEIN
jgi:hypothetical protein